MPDDRLRTDLWLVLWSLQTWAAAMSTMYLGGDQENIAANPEEVAQDNAIKNPLQNEEEGQGSDGDDPAV